MSAIDRLEAKLASSVAVRAHVRNWRGQIVPVDAYERANPFFVIGDDVLGPE
jgi:hypothetical protein